MSSTTKEHSTVDVIYIGKCEGIELCRDATHGKILFALDRFENCKGKHEIVKKTTTIVKTITTTVEDFAEQLKSFPCHRTNLHGRHFYVIKKAGEPNEELFCPGIS